MAWGPDVGPLCDVPYCVMYDTYCSMSNKQVAMHNAAVILCNKLKGKFSIISLSVNTLTHESII